MHCVKKNTKVHSVYQKHTVLEKDEKQMNGKLLYTRNANKKEAEVTILEVYEAEFKGKYK